ncbi:hypothetical protein AAG570_013994, partial [Ranatra chinensis]
FLTTSGVKQGCLLSPLFFTLFINDLDDCLKYGIWVSKIVLKSLLYTDNTVLLANSPRALQHMIDDLANYCRQWTLKVNLNKSKIIVFRNEGRPSKLEKWWFDRSRIEVVNSYKCLGVALTPKLVFRQHFKQNT